MLTTDNKFPYCLIASIFALKYIVNLCLIWGGMRDKDNLIIFFYLAPEPIKIFLKLSILERESAPAPSDECSMVHPEQFIMDEMAVLEEVAHLFQFPGIFMIAMHK